MSLAYRTYCKYGDLSVKLVSELSGTVTLSGGGQPLYVCSQAMPGWIEAGLQLSGTRRVAVEHAARHHGAPRRTWSVSWS